MYHRYNYNYHVDNDRYRDQDKSHRRCEDGHRQTSKMLVCFDSKFRQNPESTTSSDFIYHFPMTIRNVLSIRLASIELPVSWYTFSERNKSNRMFILERDDSLLHQGTLSVPMPVVGPIQYTPYGIGNVINYTNQVIYSVKTQLNNLQTLLGISGNQYDPAQPHFDIFLDGDVDTGGSHLVIENLMSIPFELSFPQVSSAVVPFNELFGFENTYYKGSSYYIGEIPQGLSVTEYVVPDGNGDPTVSVGYSYYFKGLSIASTPGQRYCMWVKERDESLYRQSMIYLYEGNYNSIQFPIALEDQLSEVMGNLDMMNGRLKSLYRYSVKIDENSGKTTITNISTPAVPNAGPNGSNRDPSCGCGGGTMGGGSTGSCSGAGGICCKPSGVPFDMNFKLGNVNADITKNMGWLMGFRKESYTGQSKYTSEGIFMSSETDYIYFVLDEFSNNDVNPIVAFLKDSYIDKNIMARVAINVDKFSIIYDDGRDTLFKKREYHGPINISKMHIKILDLHGELFDLNHMDFSFTLEFEILDEFTK